MIERYIQLLNTDAPGLEAPAETRERLKGRFPPGAARRMTQLGMLVGSVLVPLEPSADDAVVYVSEFGESRTLESYLEGFPSPSPTLFQTSIHPSGVQQGLIGRQLSVPELFPIAGKGACLGQALMAALLNPKKRVLLCGGEERGTWLRENGAASENTYAFAALLVPESGPGTLGRVRVEEDAGVGPEQVLSLYDWFGLLEKRSGYDGPLMPGLRLQLVWKTP